MISSVPPSREPDSPEPGFLDLAAILMGEDDSAEPFSDDDLIPARMLNEFAYCPRLAYLEWVQGEFSDNLDTCQGTFGHRNVDKPSARPVPAGAVWAAFRRRLINGEPDEGPTDSSSIHEDGTNPVLASDETDEAAPLQATRALTLSAPREGLVAKLDVLELEGLTVTPIDYKKGAIPDNPHQAWEPERVQLCAQGLILRENGYLCEYGELYYIESRRRIVIPFDDALVMRTRQLARQLREMAQAERLPPPLIDSPKCPRCSLVGICLPDETNLLLRDDDTSDLRAAPSAVRGSPDPAPTRTEGLPADSADAGFENNGQECARSGDLSTTGSGHLRKTAIEQRARSGGLRTTAMENVREKSPHPNPLPARPGRGDKPQRANDLSILNPSCDANKPAVPGANELPILNPSCDANKPAMPGTDELPILNPSCDAHRPAVPVPGVRKLLPARDDSLPLYVKEQGAFVGKDGDRVIVRHREAKLISVPLMEVSQVSLFGNVQMSAQALREIVDRGIPVCHFSYGGWFHAITTGHVQKNIELRIAQFAAAADPKKSLALAKGFITAKIKNCRTMLRRHGNGQVAGALRVPSTDAVDIGIPFFAKAGFPGETGTVSAQTEQENHRTDGLGRTATDSSSFRSDLDRLAECVQKAEGARSAETLLGLEGMAAKVYFAGFARILKGGGGFDMTGRNRRPPRDPVNAILSFVYGLLTKEVTIAVQAVGFDPLLGFFHKPRYGRPSLALDLAEEFRPIIADSTAMMVINNGEVSESSFLFRAGAVALTEPGRKSVIAAFERRMEQEITHPIFGYKISYRRVLEVQARLLSRVVLGELSDYPGFCTR